MTLRGARDWRIVLLAILVGLLLGLATAVPRARSATPNVGQHIHVEVANHPVDGFPIARAPYTFQVTIRRHDFPATIRYIRIDDASTTRATRTFSPGLAPCADCLTSFAWTVDFSGWSVGRHELRWHADSQDSDPSTSGTQRQFTTTRLQVCIVSCSPSYRSQKYWTGGGSWYTGPEYVVPLILSPDTSLRPGGQITIRSQYAGARACAYLNPDFHNGSHGTALGCGAVGTGTTTVAIPASASVGAKLVVVALGSQEAGVLELRLGDGSPRATTFYATQSWWAKDGLVLP